MSAGSPASPEDNSDRPQPSGQSAAFTQEVRHSQVSARVPERVGRGVFSTGAMVLQGEHEFVVDFVLRMAQPHQVAARVVLPPSLMPRLIAALRENLDNYQKRFGPPPALPAPPPTAKPPTIEEIYDQIKLPEDVLSGAYANTVMIAHSPAEFCFDFITNLYPRSAVSCRVYLSAPQIPGFLDTLTRAFRQYQQKLGGSAPSAPADPRPPAS